MAVSVSWTGAMGTFGDAELPADSYAEAGETSRREMAESLAWQASVIDAVQQAIITTDLRGIVTSVNRFAEAMYGWRADEAIGQDVRALVYAPAEAAVATEGLAQVAKGATVSRERRVRRKNGEYIWIAMTASPLQDLSGRVTHIVATSTDITERRRLEAQYHQSQKMEAVGRLAGGVAHDFNNLLTVMRANAEFLSQLLPVNGQEREDIDAITKSVDRASALTRQLLAFSRQQVMQPAIVEPNEIVADLEKMLSRLIGEDIDLRIDLGVDVPVVRVDPGQLEQAIVNLIVNARDAMPFGGPLRITTSTLKVTAAAAAAHGVVDEGSYAAISVNDSGTGMSPAVRARIFEPFFTTKEIGLGTGLGLASVYGMVKQFGGFIDVDSVEGEGSTFTIALPACPLGDPTTREAADAAAGEGAGQTILVVEDEADVRAVSSRILTGHGYRVIEASNGLEAIERLEDVKTRVDMVITDAVMPKMGGAKLIEAVRARRPGVPVLMVSGYTNKELGLSVKDESTVELLHKPFRSEELLRRVRGLLEQRA